MILSMGSPDHGCTLDVGACGGSLPSAHARSFEVKL